MCPISFFSSSLGRGHFVGDWIWTEVGFPKKRCWSCHLFPCSSPEKCIVCKFVLQDLQKGEERVVSSLLQILVILLHCASDCVLQSCPTIAWPHVLIINHYCDANPLIRYDNKWQFSKCSSRSMSPCGRAGGGDLTDDNKINEILFSWL